MLAHGTEADGGIVRLPAKAARHIQAVEVCPEAESMESEERNQSPGATVLRCAEMLAILRTWTVQNVAIILVLVPHTGEVIQREGVGHEMAIGNDQGETPGTVSQFDKDGFQMWWMRARGLKMAIVTQGRRRNLHRDHRLLVREA